MSTTAAREQLGGLRRLSLTWWHVLFGGAAVAGLVLRVWTYRSALGVPDSDEAVVGLMARHFQHGDHLTAFFWGQAYGGVQEMLLTVPIFAVFGSSWLALRIVPIALSAVAAVLVWRVGRRTIGEPAAAVAGAMYWVWPPFVIYKLTHQWGFYASGVVYCCLVLLLALRLAEAPDRLRAGLFGLVLGLGFWQSAQLVPIAIGTLLWTTWRRPAWLRLSWLTAGAALLGALPWLIWNIRHDWGSFEPTITEGGTYAHRLRTFASPLMPMMLGLRVPFTQEPLVSAILVDVVLVVALGLFAYGAWRFRRTNASLLYLVPAIYPFFYAIPRETFFTGEPKYLVVLSPLLVLLLAQLATSRARAAVLLAVACVISAMTLARMETHFETTEPVPPTAPRDLGPLVSTLDRLGVDHVYADFWLAYRLDFDTNERIVASQNKFTAVRWVDGEAVASPHPFIRYRPYEREVESTPGRGFVFFRRSLDAARNVIAELEAHGYRRTDAGMFVVYSPPAHA